jgi:hypothetical protein
MVGKEIVNEVYKYIKKNENCTKSDVERGVEVCTRLPIREAIELLMSDKGGTEEPKVKFSKNTPKGFYRLYVNDKNEFSKLVAQIDQTSKGVKMIIDLVNSNMSGSEVSKSEFQSGFKFLSLVHWSQLILYSKICKIAQGINQKIKSNTDREILYEQLIQLLLVSNKLNTELIPSVSIDLHQALSLMKDSKIRKEKIGQVYQVEDILTKIIHA